MAGGWGLAIERHTLCRRISVITGIILGLTTSAHAQDARDALEFLAGGGLGLVLHEGGHLVFDAAFDVRSRDGG